MKRLVLVFLAGLITACASIMHGTKQGVGISSSPTGAAVIIDNVPNGSTPVIATLARNDNHIVKINLEGYQPAELTLTRGVSGWVWGNIVFGGLIGLAVNAITGGLYKLTPEQLQGTLSRVTAEVAPTKDGFFLVLVQAADPAWAKVGQLVLLSSGLAH